MPKFFTTPSSRFGQPIDFYYIAYDNGKTQLLGEHNSSVGWKWVDQVYTGKGIWGREITHEVLLSVMGCLGSSSAAINPSVEPPTADDLTGGILGCGGLEA